MRRKPAVAGTFYPASAGVLRREVEAYLGPVRGEDRARAILVPHAGYIYSGPCAGATYGAVLVPQRAIVLGPNHTGRGAPLALSPASEWDTPLGPVSLDAPLARRLLELDPQLSPDEEAHRREHSIEVQVPFLRERRPDVRIVPVCVGTRRLPDLLRLGDAVAEAVREAGEDVLVVISSDMSHYLPAEEARVRDAPAIARMEALDPEGLHAVCEENDISMCGYCPAVAGLQAARRLGATSGRLVAYTHSGDRTGDMESVVAYAGLVFA